MKAVIDREGCVSCGVCVDTCPDVFRLADDGKAEVYAEVSPELEEDVKEARDSCPVSVISVEE